MTKKLVSDTLKEAVFNYLNELRESGHVNMILAGPIIKREFGLDTDQAREILVAWIESFNAE